MLKIIGIISCLVCILESQEITTQVSSDVNTVQEEPNIISREEWDAKPERPGVFNLTENPPSYIIISHSADEDCNSQTDCKAKIKSLQNHHMNENRFSDIAYNFLIGEDGNIYKGRGWGKRGSHTKIYNHKSIGICIIGEFTDREPNSIAIDALKKLIAYGVTSNIILKVIII